MFVPLKLDRSWIALWLFQFILCRWVKTSAKSEFYCCFLQSERSREDSWRRGLPQRCRIHIWRWNLHWLLSMLKYTRVLCWDAEGMITLENLMVAAGIKATIVCWMIGIYLKPFSGFFVWCFKISWRVVGVSKIKRYLLLIKFGVIKSRRKYTVDNESL